MHCDNLNSPNDINRSQTNRVNQFTPHYNRGNDNAGREVYAVGAVVGQFNYKPLQRIIIPWAEILQLIIY
jgi:hypothetical protein